MRTPRPLSRSLSSTELERLHSHYLNLAIMALAVHRTANVVELMLSREHIIATMETRVKGDA